MLASFLIAGIIGIAFGCFLRASALVAASLVFLIYASSVVHERHAITAIAISFALVATLQAGYTFGLAISGFRKRIASFLEHELCARLRPCDSHEQDRDAGPRPARLNTIDCK